MSEAGCLRLQIRAIGPDEHTVVQEIYALCISSALWLPEAARRETDFAAVSHNEAIDVAINPAGQICGFISVQEADAFIHHLFIHPAYREQGIGRQLLLALQARLPSTWRLKCVCTNHAARAFYQALGWREIARGVSADGQYALLEWQMGTDHLLARIAVR